MTNDRRQPPQRRRRDEREDSYQSPQSPPSRQQSSRHSQHSQHSRQRPESQSQASQLARRRQDAWDAADDPNTGDGYRDDAAYHRSERSERSERHSSSTNRRSERPNDRSNDARDAYDAPPRRASGQAERGSERQNGGRRDGGRRDGADERRYSQEKTSKANYKASYGDDYAEWGGIGDLEDIPTQSFVPEDVPTQLLSPQDDGYQGRPARNTRNSTKLASRPGNPGGIQRDRWLTPGVSDDTTPGSLNPMVSMPLTDPKQSKPSRRGGKKPKAKLDPKARKRRIIWGIVAGVVLIACILPSTITGFASYSFYKHDSQMANDGLAQLQKGLSLLKGLTTGQISPQTTTAAKASFVQAHDLFEHVNSDLAGLPGVASSAPHFGSEVQSARRLVPIAIAGAEMGVLGSDALNILITRVSDPFGANSQGLTATDVQAINNDFAQVKTLFDSMLGQINQLTPTDLQFNAKLASEFQKFRSSLPTIQQDITDVGTLLSLVPSLLGVGAPANYLVEMLDSTELRPGGGFIGNYGVLSLNAGRLGGLHITDVDLLDRPFEFAGYSIPFPAGYQWFNLGVSNWSVRDSNLDADFPTDARYAEKNYQTEATVDHQLNSSLNPAPLQPVGMIAITPFLIEKMLDITGPIYVPEYKETVTSANLIDEIHYHQLGPGHGSDYVPDPGSLTSQRKAFTGYLFKHFLDKVKADATTKRAAFVQLLVLSFQRKDVQLYLNSSQGEALLQKLHQASTIDAPATGDSLFVVDANITGNKSNDFISYTLQDNVTIDEKGNAVHHATLTYNWPISVASSNNNYGNNLDYHDYIRIYAPPKATLQSQDGWTPDGQSSAFGRTVFAGLFIMNYGTKASVTLTWTVPNAAYKDVQGWHYTLLQQHQAGLIWTINTQITLPSCAKVGTLTNVKAGPNHTYGLQGYLDVDSTYAINYTC